MHVSKEDHPLADNIFGNAFPSPMHKGLVCEQTVRFRARMRVRKYTFFWVSVVGLRGGGVGVLNQKQRTKDYK